ncbi:hypothetical protein [Mycolicibacterium brisbanense]|uniref:Envelope glycoprotein n=1 Tax=Mycolicibacterium brisbanense TaxID=146020 RepID=A0A100W1Z3_9MYCO|nr:hypothetical protein [Mycolicibacterium brisbanense]MCV7157504.1 hypothetical protein [Mycolicibacterium brisbanense]GAS90143.1 envelope glycoprotein [Mycolicibacterium brisbanense]
MAPLRIRQCVACGAMILAMGSAGSGIASADPPILPFVPGVPGIPYQGAYTYEFGTGSYTYPPHTTDTRGVRTSGPTADPTQTSVSLPNSKPGPPVPNQSFILNYTNMRYGVQGGIVPPDSASALLQSDTGTLPGMVSSAGPWPQPLLESPTGAPPKTGVPTGEVTNATPPSYPQLEPPAQPEPADQAATPGQ